MVTTGMCLLQTGHCLWGGNREGLALRSIIGTIFVNKRCAWAMRGNKEGLVCRSGFGTTLCEQKVCMGDEGHRSGKVIELEMVTAN